MEQELFNPQSSSVDHWGSEYQYYGNVIYWGSDSSPYAARIISHTSPW